MSSSEEENFSDPSTSNANGDAAQEDYYEASCVLKKIGTLLLESKDVNRYYQDIIKCNNSTHEDAHQKIDQIKSSMEKDWSPILKINAESEDFNVLDWLNTIHDTSDQRNITEQTWPRFLEALKEAEKCTISRFPKTTYLQFNDNEPESSAARSLARLRGRIYMEKSVLWCFNLLLRCFKLPVYNKEERVTRKLSVTEGSEETTFYSSFIIKHHLLNLGDYQYAIKQKILKQFSRIKNKSSFKDAIKTLLKEGNINDVKLFSNNLKLNETDSPLQNFKKLISLVFFIESKRNTSNLLTSAMVFDLIAEGKYKISEVPEKLPMAMKGAVEASVWIDQKFLKKNGFDYRTISHNKDEPEHKELSERDCRVLVDWLNAKHNKSISEDGGRITVPGEHFRDLISDWYGIKLQDGLEQNYDIFIPKLKTPKSNSANKRQHSKSCKQCTHHCPGFKDVRETKN